MNTATNVRTGSAAEEKRALLAARLRKAVVESQAIPLSFPQQRLWFLDQLEPNSPLYNMPNLLRLTGELNLEALQKSLDVIVRRHEVLRTRFVCPNESPQQVIDPGGTVKLERVDLTRFPVSGREAEARRLVHQ